MASSILLISCSLKIFNSSLSFRSKCNASVDTTLSSLGVSNKLAKLVLVVSVAIGDCKFTVENGDIVVPVNNGWTGVITGDVTNGAVGVTIVPVTKGVGGVVACIIVGDVHPFTVSLLLVVIFMFHGSLVVSFSFLGSCVASNAITLLYSSFNASW